MANHRVIALFILILAILPWGAYTSALKPQVQDSGFALPFPEARQTASRDEPPGPTLAVSIGKRCHGPAILGSPCGPQVVLPGASPLSASIAGSAELRPGLHALPMGIAPPSSLDPPRSS
jgi:hypothetical protein